MDNKNDSGFENTSIEELARSPELEIYSPSEIDKKSVKTVLSKKIISRFSVLLILVILGVFLFLHKKQSSTHITNLKEACPNFTGRSSYLTRLQNDLLINSGDQSVKIRGIWGKGGFGKSELAIQFAHVNFQHFSMVWSFCCDSPEQVNQGYRDLAAKLNILTPSDSPLKIRQVVHEYLENTRFTRPWLLIFDNVEAEFTDYPRKGGVIVVTSQKQVLPSNLHIEVAPFAKDEGVELLAKITREKPGKVMQQLVHDLEGIPLLISYAAHYIKATPGSSVKEYQTVFSQHLLEKEGPLWSDVNVNARYLKSLAASWHFTLQSLEKDNPDASEWLSVCSYFHPEQIPVEWLVEWTDQQNAKSSPEQILKILQNYGLIRYEEQTKRLSIHRFLQYILHEDQKTSDPLAQALILLAKHSEDFDFSNISTWEGGKVWFLHASELKKRMEQAFLDEKYALFQYSLYSGLAKCFNIFGLYKESLIEAYKSLEFKNRSLPIDVVDICRIYNRIAYTLYKIGEYEESLSYCKKVEELLNDDFLKKTKAYIGSQDTQGWILYEQSLYEEAIKKLENALGYAIEVYGRINIMTAGILHALGLCFASLGKHDEALELRKEITNIYLQTCGENHPSFAFNLNAQGWILYEKKQYKKALEYFKRAYNIFEAVQITKDNECLCFPLMGMGECHLKLRNIKSAKKDFRQALPIACKYFGKNTRMAAEAYDGLGKGYLESGNVKKGLKYLIKRVRAGAQAFKNTPTMVSILDEFQKSLNLAVEMGGDKKVIYEAATTARLVSEELFGKEHSLTLSFDRFNENLKKD